MSYAAYVTTIKELRQHSNADRLQVATVFGTNVIVDLNVKVGDRVVYFPSDGQLSQTFCEDNNLVRKTDGNGNNIGGYLDPDKRNIKAIKLRGEVSDGLILPVECLGKYGDISNLSDGDMGNTFYGVEICRKYIPNKNNNIKRGVSTVKRKEPIDAFPFFEQHVDTKQLRFCKDAFKEGDTCYITVKMHGTSGRTANTIKESKQKRSLLDKIFRRKPRISKEYSYVSGTRRVTLESFEGGYYGDDSFREKWHKFFEGKLPKGIEVFYEIVGYLPNGNPIMGSYDNKKYSDKAFRKQYGDTTVFSYGCEEGENKIYVYRMTYTNEDGDVFEIPWEEVKLMCERMGVPTVVQCDKFMFTDIDDLMQRVEKFYDGADPIGKTHVREGVVIRIDNRERFTAFKHKNDAFKILEGIMKDTAEVPDIEEAQEEEV